MSRTSSAHWISDSLNNRIYNIDTTNYDPFEISLGYGHQEINHLLDIISDSQSPKKSKIKSLKLLYDILSGREDEAFQLHCFDILKPFLLQPTNSLLLNCLLVLSKLITRIDQAKLIITEIPRLIEIIHPDNEIPFRIAACSLLRQISELLGPIEQFTEGNIPILITSSISSNLSTKPFLFEAFRFLSRLVNIQKVRVPVISSIELLQKIVNSISDEYLQSEAINLSNNISMDKSHRGKLALLNEGIVDVLPPLLKSNNINIRMSVLSLLTLLAVPREGKELLSTVPEIADLLLKITNFDSDYYCRKAAKKVREFIAEIPFGKVIVGEINDEPLYKKK